VIWEVSAVVDGSLASVVIWGVSAIGVFLFLVAREVSVVRVFLFLGVWEVSAGIGWYRVV
jgi:hypothetical protein